MKLPVPSPSLACSHGGMFVIPTDDYFGDDMDSFTASYIETALWSETDNADSSGGQPLDANYSIDNIDPVTLERMKADCAKFMADNAADIEHHHRRAGHDFWLTRNHHGAGFWDGDWPDEAGERLTAASHAFKEYNLYVGDDKKIHGGA